MEPFWEERLLWTTDRQPNLSYSLKQVIFSVVEATAIERFLEGDGLLCGPLEILGIWNPSDAEFPGHRYLSPEERKRIMDNAFSLFNEAKQEGHEYFEGISAYVREHSNDSHVAVALCEWLLLSDELKNRYDCYKYFMRALKSPVRNFMARPLVLHISSINLMRRYKITAQPFYLFHQKHAHTIGLEIFLIYMTLPTCYTNEKGALQHAPHIFDCKKSSWKRRTKTVQRERPIVTVLEEIYYEMQRQARLIDEAYVPVLVENRNGYVYAANQAAAVHIYKPANRVFDRVRDALMQRGNEQVVAWIAKEETRKPSATVLGAIKIFFVSLISKRQHISPTQGTLLFFEQRSRGEISSLLL